jgi:hypothetical protein
VIIFLSYSSADYKLVQPLAVELGMLGHDVLFEQKLPGADVGWVQVFESIKSCDLFIFALTPWSIQSASGRIEYQYAYTLQKRILPVLLDGFNVHDLPDELIGIPWIDYRNRDGSGLRNALDGLPPARALAWNWPIHPDLMPSLRVLYTEQLSVSEMPQTQWSLFRNLREFLERKETNPVAAEILRAMQSQPQLAPPVGAAIQAVFKDLSKNARSRRLMLGVRAVVRDVGLLLAGAACLFLILRGSIFVQSALGQLPVAVVETCPDPSLNAVSEVGADGTAVLLTPSASPLQPFPLMPLFLPTAIPTALAAP